MIVNVFIKIRNTIEDKLNMKELFNIKSLIRNSIHKLLITTSSYKSYSSTARITLPNELRHLGLDCDS